MGYMRGIVVIPISGKGKRLGKYTVGISSKAFVQIKSGITLLEMALISATNIARSLGLSNISYTIIYRDSEQKKELNKLLSRQHNMLIYRNISTYCIKSSRDPIEATLLLFKNNKPQKDEVLIIWPTDVVIFTTIYEKLLLTTLSKMFYLFKQRPIIIFIINKTRSPLDNYFLIGKKISKVFIIQKVLESRINNVALSLPVFINKTAFKILETTYFKYEDYYVSLYRTVKEVAKNSGIAVVSFVDKYYNINTPADLLELSNFLSFNLKANFCI